MSDQKLPPGWDEARIREVIEHYDLQDEDERAAAIDAAWEAEGMTLMSVPTELVRRPGGSDSLSPPMRLNRVRSADSQSIERRVVPQHADQTGGLPLAALDEVDGEADDGVPLLLELPDPELAADRVAPPAVAGELDPRRFVSKRVALGVAVFADVEIAALSRSEEQVPVPEWRDLALDAPCAGLRVRSPLS